MPFTRVTPYMSTVEIAVRGARALRIRIKKFFVWLWGLPVVAGFAAFLQYVFTTGMNFSYKLVGVFLAFAIMSNIFSKIVVRVLQRV